MQGLLLPGQLAHAIVGIEPNEPLFVEDVLYNSVRNT